MIYAFTPAQLLTLLGVAVLVGISVGTGLVILTITLKESRT